jgi:hypothetical protein
VSAHQQESDETLDQAKEQPLRGLGGASRAECLLYASFAGVLNVFARVFQPSKVDDARSIQYALWLLMGWFLLRALLGPGRWPSGRVRLGLNVLVALVVLKSLLKMLGSTAMVVMGFTSFFVTLMVAGVVGLACTITSIFAWRGRLSSRVPRLLWAFSFFIGAFLFIPFCLWLWQPPTLEVCTALEAKRGVKRITPHSYVEEFSFPYELDVIEERDLLVSSFKMAGNLAFEFWNNPEANQLVVIDLADESFPANITRLTQRGDMMPEFFSYHPGREMLALTHLGRGEHAFSLIDLSRPSAPQERAFRPLPFEPAGILWLQEGETLGIFGFQGELEVWTVDPLELRASFQMPLDLPNFQLVIDVKLRPGTWKAYAATAGQEFLSIEFAEDILAKDLFEGARNGLLAPKQRNAAYRWLNVQKAPIDFGVGQLAMSSNTAVVSNIWEGAAAVMDLKTFAQTASLELDYKPRAVAINEKLGLLFLGEWFHGDVYIYRLATLEHLAGPISLGPYLRELTVDEKRNRLYGGSKCGLYQLDVGTVLEQPGS